MLSAGLLEGHDRQGTGVCLAPGVCHSLDTSDYAGQKGHVCLLEATSMGFCVDDNSAVSVEDTALHSAMTGSPCQPRMVFLHE